MKDMDTGTWKQRFPLLMRRDPTVSIPVGWAILVEEVLDDVERMVRKGTETGDYPVAESPAILEAKCKWEGPPRVPAPIDQRAARPTPGS